MDDIEPRQRVRIAKLIASRGLASRREAERWIAEGQVTVGGAVVREPGTSVDPDRDDVRVRGKRLPPPPKRAWYVMYKPRGLAVERREGEASVADVLDELGLRVAPVGRLEVDVEGALLLTNDGDLADRLVRGSTAAPRRYVAKVYRTPSEAALRAIERGVSLPEGRVRPAKARVLEQTDRENAWIEITLTEGRPRLVHRMLAQLGHPVSKLRRETFATITIRGMQRGQVRELAPDEVARLTDIANGTTPERAGHGWRKPGFARPKPRTKRPGKPRRGPTRKS